MIFFFNLLFVSLKLINMYIIDFRIISCKFQHFFLSKGDKPNMLRETFYNHNILNIRIKFYIL